MRIGFDARLIGSLGIGRYISGLLPPLAEALRDRLVVISRPADLALVRALTSGQGRLVPSNAAPYRITEQTSLLLKLVQAETALTHFPHYNLPLAFPRRFVVTIHDLFSFQFPDIHSGRLARMANRLLISNAIGRAAEIITPSNATASELRLRFPSSAGRLTAVPEAASDRFSPVRNPQAEAAWQRYFQIRAPYFLYLGQWKAYKNVPLLIEAFSRLLSQHPGAQLVIAGNDPRHPEVRHLSAALPRGSVVLPGHLPDDAVPDVYRAATALVLPSRAEGFGLPVLEAMACGIPVVCSDIPVMREIADGLAIFADAENPDSLAAGMAYALKGPNQTRIAAGLARAAEFSWNKAAEATVAIYERVLAGRPRTRSETE